MDHFDRSDSCPDWPAPSKLLVLAASPAPAGTTALLARHMAGCFAQSLGSDQVRLLSLAGRHILGCTHCRACETKPGFCSLDRQDGANFLLEALASTEHLVWISPVYFYTVPAIAKALMDRCQKFYMQDRQPAPEQGRTHALFVAGRTKGKLLFQGSLLPVRHCARALGRSFSGAYGLRGMEEAADLDECVLAEVATLCTHMLAEQELPDEPAFSRLEPVRLT